MHLTVEAGSLIEGQLRYSESEYSFYFEVASRRLLEDREGMAGRASVSVGTLQIEVGVSNGAALFVWGLHPRTGWSSGPIPAPSTIVGIVRFGAKFETAVSQSIAQVGEWSTVYDSSSGWLRVAPPLNRDETLVEIANGVVLGEREGELSSVWLNPVKS
jgi:hypothetical protein